MEGFEFPLFFQSCGSRKNFGESHFFWNKPSLRCV